MKILRKRTVCAEFRAVHPKLYGNFAFPQNFHTTKLGEISVFYAMVKCICPAIFSSIFVGTYNFLTVAQE